MQARAHIVGDESPEAAGETEPRGLWASTRILLEPLRAREGLFVCEMTNHSRSPAFVFIPLNRSGLYGGSGLIGLAIRLLGASFRFLHLTLGH